MFLESAADTLCGTLAKMARESRMQLRPTARASSGRQKPRCPVFSTPSRLLLPVAPAEYTAPAIAQALLPGEAAYLAGFGLRSTARMPLPAWLGLIRTVPGYNHVVRRLEALDSDLRKFLRLFVFWGLRFCFWTIDAVAAYNFESCAEGCGFVEAPRTSCEALILSIAIFNFFALVAFIIFLLVRYTSDDRDRAEARFVTRVLITVGMLLKLADIGMTVAVYTICFPDSATPPYENFMSMTQCAGTIQNPACPFMDFFALYGIYAVLKVREQVSE